MSTEEKTLLEEMLEEFRLLRKAVERVETRLLSAPARTPSKPRQPVLSEEEWRKLYREISEEYIHEQTTRGLDALLNRSRSEIAHFCSVNNLPIDLRSGKSSIREQLLARLRENQQLAAAYPMPSREPAFFGERKQ